MADSKDELKYEHYHAFPPPNEDEITGPSIDIDGVEHVHIISKTRLTKPARNTLEHIHVFPNEGGDGLSSPPVNVKGEPLVKGEQNHGGIQSKDNNEKSDDKKEDQKESDEEKN